MTKKRDTKTTKRTKLSPKKQAQAEREHAKATLARWNAVAAAGADPATMKGRQGLPLIEMLSIASDFPMGAQCDTAAMATAFGMVEMWSRLSEIDDAIWPLEMGKAVATAWLVTQKQHPPGDRWPIMLISRCLRAGEAGWGSAFNDVFGDCDGLADLEDCFDVEGRQAARKAAKAAA